MTNSVCVLHCNERCV